MAGIPKVRRGGGPKTEAGKLSSSINALKTVAYSSQLTLAGESEADFKNLEEQLVRDFSPKDMAERILIHDLAVITWKKIRLNRLEHTVMLSAFNKPVSIVELEREGVLIGYE